MVNLVLEGYDEIGGKKLTVLYQGKMKPPKISSDESEADNKIYTTEHELVIPKEVEAIKLYYSVYNNSSTRSAAIARGEVWSEE